MFELLPVPLQVDLLHAPLQVDLLHTPLQVELLHAPPQVFETNGSPAGSGAGHSIGTRHCHVRFPDENLLVVGDLSGR